MKMMVWMRVKSYSKKCFIVYFASLLQIYSYFGHQSILMNIWTLEISIRGMITMCSRI